MMYYIRYGQVSVMENLIKCTLTRWRHYNLLCTLVGAVVNGTNILSITRYIYIQYKLAINLIGDSIINHTALLHSAAWKRGGVWGP